MTNENGGDDGGEGEDGGSSLGHISLAIMGVAVIALVAYSYWSIRREDLLNERQRLRGEHETEESGPRSLGDAG